MSLYLCLFPLSLYLSQTYTNLKYACQPASLLTRPPTRLPLSLSLYPPPSLFPDKKFLAVKAQFWLDELFYIIDCIFLLFFKSYYVLPKAQQIFDINSE